MGMRLQFFFYIPILICCIQIPAKCQILDDSTELVYGAYTAYYATLDNIKYNDKFLNKVDTLIHGLHSFDVVSGSGYRYQNLGNIGTSLFPVFYEPPKNIGAYSGFTSFVPYYLTDKDFKFFDTKSPFTLLDVVLGGGRRSKTMVRFSRNISPFWNFGFQFNRISAEKQVASSGRNDRQTVSTSYYLHTSYQSENKKLNLATAFSRTNHEVQESGGIDSTGFFTNAQYFLEEANINLTDAENSDLNLQLLAYADYKWKPQLQFYYQWDQRGTKYFFTDNSLSSEGDFFNEILINTDSTYNKAHFNESKHEIGIKGDQQNLFYSAYLKFRKVNYLHQFLEQDYDEFEQYIGGVIRYNFDTLNNHSLNGKTEFMLGGNFLIRADYRNKFFSATYQKSRYMPSIIQRAYFGNHDEWHNGFESIGSDFISGKIDVHFKNQRIAPKFSLTNLRNNIYWNHQGDPTQTSGFAQILSPGLEIDLTFFKKIHFNNEIIFTKIVGDTEAVDALRIPDWFANSKFFYRNPLIRNTVTLELGLQFHFKSNYFAPSYDPVMRQLFLQDTFEVPAYLIADLFVDFRIDHFTLFLRWEHLNQQRESGYFTYPTYIGQKKTLSFGVTWMFFD